MKRMKSTHTPAKKFRQRGYATPPEEVKFSIYGKQTFQIWIENIPPLEQKCPKEELFGIVRSYRDNTNRGE